MMFQIKHMKDFPFPNDVLDSIFHVDVFYFWHSADMRGILAELFRILKPGGTLVCGMELSRLRRLEKYDIVRSEQFDPMRYLMHLEPLRFVDVKLEYDRIAGDREVQIITAKKPEESEESMDADLRFKKLEAEIKMRLAMESMLESENRNAALEKEAAKLAEEAADMDKKTSVDEKKADTV